MKSPKSGLGPATQFNELFLQAKLLAVLGLIVLLATGCVQTKSPEFEDLIEVQIPYFVGLDSNDQISVMNTSSNNVNLRGLCDPISFALEYSSDEQKSWTEISGGCSEKGDFKISVNVVKVVKLYVRAKTKKGVTSAASLRLRYLLPPASNSLMLASSSSAVDDGGETLQSVSGHSFQGNPSSSSMHKLDLYLPGIVYAQ